MNNGYISTTMAIGLKQAREDYKKTLKSHDTVPYAADYGAPTGG